MMLAAAEVIAFPSMYERVVAIPRTTPSDTPLDRALAEVAAGLFAEAASLFEHMGSLPLAARAGMLAATAARERNHMEEAAQCAAMARSFYESVGASVLAAQAAALEHAPT